jgi:hypothetical protein
MLSPPVFLFRQSGVFLYLSIFDSSDVMRKGHVKNHVIPQNMDEIRQQPAAFRRLCQI